MNKKEIINELESINVFLNRERNAYENEGWGSLERDYEDGYVNGLDLAIAEIEELLKKAKG